MTLTEFLLARIAEDEAVAQAASWQGRYAEWELADANQSLRVQTVGTEGNPGYERHIEITHDSEGLSDSVVTRDAGEHIARHDPARVLARCAADRLIVGYYTEAVREGDNADVRESYTDALEALASIYADHPSYDESWRP